MLLALRLGEVARLAEDLEQRDRAQDLHLAQRGQSVPLLAGEARLRQRWRAGVRVRVRVRVRVAVRVGVRARVGG